MGLNRRSVAACRGASRWLLGLALGLAAALPPGAAQALDEKADAARVARKVEKARSAAHQAREEREALEDFQEEVEDYAKLQARLAGRLGHQESLAGQEALARAIAAKRSRARPGDVFQPEVHALFRRLLAEQLRGPDALAARKAVLEGNPGEAGDDVVVPVELRVNGTYPVGASRSTVPASVLLALPPLPEPLHYRFAGRDLVLVDSVSGLIVDFLPAAAPDLGNR